MLQVLELIVGMVGAVTTLIIVLCILYWIYRVCYDILNNIITKRNDKIKKKCVNEVTSEIKSALSWLNGDANRRNVSAVLEEVCEYMDNGYRITGQQLRSAVDEAFNQNQYKKTQTKL